ncbi:SDR family oxidoreductase [Alkalihalobacterium alkalinitrilicum]|uniref:SDR family oxidoreductase n=1 Tax=Alkalihalobacterium alkalinitrilicum TaxID=427920 RepID=UPI000994EA79|nr:SDR family oxidoreductase [Alkalihalobacterium alkalinitrilicum]
MNVFLTGGTGFLGTQLILQLINSKHKVYVLARSKKKSQNLLDKIPLHLQSQVEVIEGELSNHDLSISKEDQNRLFSNIDVFYHIAALLSFDIKKKDELREINYNGTQNTLEFAKNIGVKSYFYVSTAYTLGKKDRAIEKLHDLNGEFNNAYERTKCEAEHLVMNYSETMKVSIFRPAIIVGDSKTGETDSVFGLYGFLKGLEIFKKRVARVGGEYKQKTFTIIGNPIGTQNFVPVDYVCDILLAGIEKAESRKIYHITNPNPPVNNIGLKVIEKLLDLPQIQFSQKENITLTKEEVVLNDFISSFKVYFNRDIDFDISNTLQLLKETDNSVLKMDEEMFKTIIVGYKKEREPVLS